MRDLAFVKTYYYSDQNENNVDNKNNNTLTEIKIEENNSNDNENEVNEEIKIILNETLKDNFFFPKMKTHSEINKINKFFRELNYKIYTGKWYQIFEQDSNKEEKNKKDGYYNQFKNQQYLPNQSPLYNSPFKYGENPFNKPLFENTTSGELLMKMERIEERSFDSQMSFYGLKLLKGNYIDNWISFNGISNSYRNITIKDNKIKIFYSSFMEKGEIFETYSQVPLCSGEFNIEYSTKILNETDEKFENFEIKREFIDSYNGTFFSNCGVNIRFEMSLKSEFELYRKVTLYSIFLSIFLLLQIANNIMLIRKIGDSTSICNAV